MHPLTRRHPPPPSWPLIVSLSLSLSLSIHIKPSLCVDELQVQASDTFSLLHLTDSNLSALVQRRPAEECDLAPSSPLKVFVYDLPPKFNVDLFAREDPTSSNSSSNAQLRRRNGRTVVPYRRREDGTVAGKGFEHSAEAFITLDLLNPPEVNSSTTQGNEIVRVLDPAAADVFFVPFLASLSFDKYSVEGMHSALVENDKQLQEELLQILLASEWWQRSGGADHILGMVQPNALRFVRNRLYPAMFLVADFGRCPQSVSRLSKDIVVPYNHMLPSLRETPADAEASWARRKTLLYFQGTVVRKNEGYIRKILYDMLHGEADVHFANSKADAAGVLSATEGMRGAKFCLHAAGDTPSSCRLFDALVNHCVPLIISNKLELPYESSVDYSEFSVFLSHEDVLREGNLLRTLRGMPKDEWLRRWRRMMEVQEMFEFQVPSLRGDAVSMMWREVRSRLRHVRRRVHEYQRKLLTRAS